MHETILHARIFIVRQKTNCKTQTTIFAKSTVSGLQVPSPSGTRVAKTPHIACRDSFRKPGPSYPALFFSLCTCKKSLRLASAFASVEKGGDDSAAALGHSGRRLRDSRSYAIVLSDLRRCKTAFYRTGHRATIYGAGAVMRHRAAIYRAGRLCDIAQLSFIA